MLRVFLMLAVVFAVGFAENEDLENISDEGSGKFTADALFPGDDEDGEYEMSASGELPVDFVNETSKPTIIDTEGEFLDNSNSYVNEPEVDDYEVNYDNGNDSSINIDSRKEDKDEDDLTGEEPVEEEIDLDITETDGSETVEETIEVDVKENEDNLESEIDEELEVIKDEIFKDSDEDVTEPVKPDMVPSEKPDPDTESTRPPKPVDPNEPKSASLLNNNQFLAAIIVGGCVGLLLAVCVIAVFAYRLKKKDEGSYSLDDHKKPASNNYQYTQGQEYYA